MADASKAKKKEAAQHTYKTEFFIIANNKNYSLELHADGIYLYEKLDESERLTLALQSKLKVDSDDDKDNEDILERTLLQKITLVASSYDLIFSIVDAIVNRSLQRGFSFETDNYAQNLRIIFSLLVPKCNTKFIFVHLQDKLKTKSIEFDAEAFMAIKMLLDGDARYEHNKHSFLNIPENIQLQTLDEKLLEALDQYHSDDSDSEANTSDKEEDAVEEKSMHDFDAHPQKKQTQQDIETLNHFLRTRDPKHDKLELTPDNKIKIRKKVLSVDFVIPGFRGINHMPLRFSDEARRFYRTRKFQDLRTHIPYYSEAALMSRFDFYRDLQGIKEHFSLDLQEDNPNVEELNKNAVSLEQYLLELHNQDYILATGLSNGAADDVRLFSNLLFFLQHIYSNGIIKCQRLLHTNFKKGETLYKGPNAFNPFVSESEVPEHALRYSFGQKVLYLPAALHPHYNKNGRPAFPYIGEIFISLRGAEVFASKRERHQLRKLERLYKVNPSMYIGPEIESTGFAWLPKGEVVFSKTIKCPNFSKDWKKQYLVKYGLGKKAFNDFKQRFSKCKTKKDCLKVEQDIINHLIEHYKQDLINQANKYAIKKNNVLVFLSADGTLDFKLPERDMSSDADKDAKIIRNMVEKKLRDIATARAPILTAKLTSKTLNVYSVTEAEVQNVLASFIKKHPEKEKSYQQFVLQEQQFSTSPDSLSLPRTTFVHGKPILFIYSGSPGTPMEKTAKYKLIVSEDDVIVGPKKLLFLASPGKPANPAAKHHKENADMLGHLKEFEAFLSDICKKGLGKDLSQMSEEEQIHLAKILSLQDYSEGFIFEDNRFISALGLSCKNVKGDGFCFFRAIAEQIISRNLSNLAFPLPTTMEAVLERVAIYFSNHSQALMDRVFPPPRRVEFGTGDKSDELYQAALAEYRDPGERQHRLTRFRDNFYEYINLGKYESRGHLVNAADWLPQIISDILHIDVDIYDGNNPGRSMHTNNGYQHRIGLGRINDNHYISLNGNLDHAWQLEQQLMQAAAANARELSATVKHGKQAKLK